MNRLEQIRVALDKPIVRNIRGADVEFTALPVTDLPEFYEIADGSRKNNNELTKEGLRTAVKLIIKMVEQAFPIEPGTKKEDYDEIITQYVMQNWMELLNVLMELHSPKTVEDKRLGDSLKDLKEKQNEAGPDKVETQVG